MSKKKILVVDDEAVQRDLLKGYLTKKNYEVFSAASGEEAIEIYHSAFAPVALIDMKMPGMNGIRLIGKLKEINPFIQVIVLTAFGSVETAVEAMQAGAFHYITKPVENLDELVLKLEKAAAQNELIVDSAAMREKLADVFPDTELIGESKSIKEVKRLISLVGPKDTTVLVTGASGTGKELVARGIHAYSPRREKRLVSINCAAFPENLLESELFGYEKGAFTGADKVKQGRFELADGGSLFLDEIGEMPLTMQAKLLRVLEDHTIERLGSVNQIPLDIRLIAATNRDLKQMVKEKEFREDLYFRLNVVEINLPPLKERGGDILLLAKIFLDKYSKKIGKELKGIESDAVKVLSEYDWPGNVRELENVIERSIILTQSNQITTGDLVALTSSGNDESSTDKIIALAEMEKKFIRRCLEQNDWNIGKSAEILGIHRNTLSSKIKEYGLSKDSQ